MRKLLLVAYWVFVLLHVGNYEFGFGLDYWFKPLLMPILMVWLYLSVEPRTVIGFRLAMAALFFGWLGDVLLMYQQVSNHYFMLGLAAFLIGHVVYAFAYPKLMTAQPVKDPLLITQKLRHSATIILAGLAMFVILSPHLGELRLPVMIYVAVLVFMTIMALLRYGYTSQSSFAYIFGGAICFMISDSLLAVNKFLEPINYSSFWVMLTYCLAQMLISKGVAVHLTSDSK